MSKPALTYHQQLGLLKSRGLNVPDEAFALHVLEHHNYYRLSAYRFPFTVSGNPDLFKPGTEFNQIWALYEFDRNLRQLVMEACKHFEISVRSRWAYELAHQYNPLAYLENNLYADPLIHAKTLTKIDSEMNRSKEVFIKHHQKVLKMQWPPVWVISEVLSFGNVSTLIGQHTSPAFRQSIANTYDLDELVFCSILQHFTVLRNTAAHHSRIWNRRFTVTMELPRKKPANLIVNLERTSLAGGNPKERRIYNSLVMLIYLVQKIEPQSSLPKRLYDLITTLDFSLLTEMEFPADWQNRPIWKALQK